MRIARAILSILVATTVTTSTLAQIRIIPREKRDSVSNPPTLSPTDIHFPKGRHIHFGTIAEEGGVQSRQVEWHNNGNETITITRITTSCGCVRCHCEPQSVEAGKSGAFVISYNPKGELGVMRNRAFVYTNLSAQIPTLILDIDGTVTASAEQNSDYPHAIGALLLRNREIALEVNNGKQVVRIGCMNSGKTAITPQIDPLLSSSMFTLRSNPTTLQPSEQGEIIVCYTPTENSQAAPLRLFIENRNLPPRNREIKIKTTLSTRK